MICLPSIRTKLPLEGIETQVFARGQSSPDSRITCPKNNVPSSRPPAEFSDEPPLALFFVRLLREGRVRILNDELRCVLQKPVVNRSGLFALGREFHCDMLAMISTPAS